MVGLAQWSAHAQTAAINSPDSSGYIRNYSGTVGFEFSLNGTVPLYSLGALDLGVSSTPEVGIFDTDGNLLASATVVVSGASNDQNQFDYSTALSFSHGFTGTLAANTDYIIGLDGTTAKFYNRLYSR